MANEKQLIDFDELVAHFRATKIDEVFPNWKELFPSTQAAIIRLTTKYRAIVLNAPIVEAVEVVHGRWILTANEEYSNYRWNVTAECSECHHGKGEVYAGFFTGFPKDLARDVVLDNAKKVKLDNYCPNCGAKMDGDGNG